MVLSRTLICRNIWQCPWENIIGEWGVFASDGTLNIMMQSYFGKIENARQYFNKICDLRITERNFMTAMFNYTSGLIEAKKMDSAMFFMNKFKEQFEKEYKNNESYLATFYSNLAIVYAAEDDFQQALVYDEKAYDLRK